MTIYNNDSIAFKSKFEQERFWNFYEIKACLVKYNDYDKWKIAFLNVQLLKENTTIQKQLPESDCFKLVHEIHEINSFVDLLNQITIGKNLKVGSSDLSLELITNQIYYDLKIRSYAQQEYNIDQPCYILIKSGNYTKELDEILRNSRSILLNFVPSFASPQVAIKKLLGIDFGSPAFCPFLRILAPIYVKISKVKINGKKIVIDLNASLEVDIDKVKVFLYGNDDHGQQTDFSKSITAFHRINNSESFSPVEFDLDPKSTYVKVVLHYRDDLIEDFYVKRTQDIPRIGVSEEIEVSAESISRKKESIRSDYESAKQEVNINVKGRLLEQVISQILGLVPDLYTVSTRIDDGIQEIDIYVRNHNRKYVWADFNGMIFVECKNWSSAVSSDEIMKFSQKLDNKGLKSGIFVAMNGITGRNLGGAKGQLILLLQKGIKIIVIEGRDIEDILNCMDVSDKVDQKYIDMYK
jgi:hypothetical protein